MEARDTVMKPEEYNLLIERYKSYPKTPSSSGRNDLVEFLNKSQAEITWPIAKAEGIREVVEWIKTNSIIYRLDQLDYECSHFADQLLVDEEEWLESLKGWGIEDE